VGQDLWCGEGCGQQRAGAQEMATTKAKGRIGFHNECLEYFIGLKVPLLDGFRRGEIRWLLDKSTLAVQAAADVNRHS
jgi:hypothetical protein